MSRYDDIINLPHHVSPTRQRMSMHDRAAQFAPFAALVGYDDAVAETARLTESRPDLDEQEQQALNAKLCTLADHIQDHPTVRIRYYVPDALKSGGAIIEICDQAVKISAETGLLTLANKRTVEISSIVGIELIGL